ncbi:AP-4 complex accessory subunit RUSC1 isoform X2 [Anolis carolinensis]|uniref:AP-4 complex accessory subunit RUSC1 isoform X2 n=1 Tax=Anolis carolinensis TaxID=28377 RepID=UPI002F2B21D3
MQSPKKGLLCNLNHVHLQHISLGLHLSRHPELQEESHHTLGPLRKGTAGQDGREHSHVSALVDANSNDPSLTCQCCDEHPLHPDLKWDLQILQALPRSPVSDHEEEEEDSPLDPASSSASSCSDLSLDDTPVSVYWKEFPAEEAAQSPENQPNIVPLEEAQNVASPKEGNVNLNGCPISRVWDSPDSLGSITSLESTPSPSSKHPSESLMDASPTVTPPPVRPCRAPPAVPVRRVAPGLDSNCNALPVQEPKLVQETFSPGQVDVNLNPRPRVVGPPPPVPPRTKRGLQGIRRREPETPSEPSTQQSADAKNITSFHELAQKRKKVSTTPPTKKDQSDWLIVFSPDTELPPCHEAMWGNVPNQKIVGPQTMTLEPANVAKEVTMFKELRCRKQKSHLPAQVGAQQVKASDPLQESDPEPPPKGHFRGPKETPLRKKKSRPGLQPIMEGGFEEGEDGASERHSEGKTKGRRDPWMPGKEESADGRSVEANAPPVCSSQPQPLPFQPLLLRFSVVDGQAADPLSSSSSVCPGLESVELTSPERSGQAFCPRLKALSCEEVCLLADRQGQIFGTLSPEELLPIRLSPVGAYSPPSRSALPFLESPDLAVLFSPLFPRSRTFPTLAFPTRQVLEPPFRARVPLDSQAGAGPGRLPWDSMAAKEPGVPEQLQHSQSFGGIASNGHLWREDVDRLSAQLREQKKALLVAVSASVDKIVAHFSTARNLVQKAQLGDSRLSPDVGYLVLSTLCPALWALVGDGLKPFQKDVITGQRPSSPWSVVEASAKPGPQARSLNALYWRVSRLAPLRSSQQRFHAFILGLLNLKQLEQWFAHLQQNSELILALYMPTAFLVLSQGLCRCWTEELLLLLQPLSMLTFQLDLLFEHHHLPFNVRPMPRRAITPTEPLTGSSKASGLRWLDLPSSRQAEGPLVQPSPVHGSQEEVPLRQRLLQWGDRLTYTLIGNEASSKTEPGPQTMCQEMEEKQQSWWQQLTLSSGIYADSTSVSKQESFPYTQWAKLRVAVGGAIKEARVSMAEAAGSSNTGPGESSSLPATEAMGQSPKVGAAKKLETMAPNARESSYTDFEEGNDHPEAVDSPESGNGKRLGWLFGANCPGASSEPDQSLPKSSRRPSRWLPPTMNVLALVMKTVPAEKSWQKESWEDVSPDPLQTYRAVRALCDHVGSEDNQLSFRKGDILQVLDTVDEDWLQCCQGDRRGLVPVGYTSLIL